MAAVALGLLIVVAGSLPVPDTTSERERVTGNVGEITGSMEVGQTFVSSKNTLIGVAFRMATYSDRRNTEPVIFELRTEPTETATLRRTEVPAGVFRDRQPYVFRFRPVHGARGKTFYASLRSPLSQAGNAVTVQLANPSPADADGGSLYLWRGSSADRITGVALARKPHADLAFAVVNRVPLARVVGQRIYATLGALRRDPARTVVLTTLALAALGLGVAIMGPTGRRPWRIALLTAIVVLALALRGLYARHLPYTNDEHTQLYDAWTVTQGRLPAGDGLLKTPVTIGILSTVVRILPPDLAIARGVSVLANLLTLLPLLLVFRRLAATWSLALAGIWLLTSASAIFGLYVHAQPLQLLFGSGALACWLASLTTGNARARIVLSAAAGFLGALAFGSRKTSTAFALPALAGGLLLGRSWKRLLSTTALALGAFAVTMALLAGGVHHLYGGPGVRYFLGDTVAKIDRTTTGSPEERTAAFVKGVLPLFREALPVVLLALVGIGGTLQRLLHGRSAWTVVARAGWLLPLGVSVALGAFFRQNAAPRDLAFGIGTWWTVLPLLLVVCAFLPHRDESGRRRDETDPGGSRRRLAEIMVPLAWLVGVGLLYASWIKFTSNYLSEFLPALCLLAASGSVWLWRTIRAPAARVAAGVVVMWAAYVAARSGYVFEHTGTFDVQSVREAAAILRQQVPSGTEILTAATGIPLLSGHRVLLDIAHPTHYAYGFIEPEVRNIYMPTREVMVATVLREAQWVVLERLTAFSYFREYPEIEALVRDKFETVATVENLSNPITILRKRTP